jgi:hypothetical protein
MERSQEIRDLTLRLYEALTAGDVSFMERYISREPSVLSIGSDPNEWWLGYETILRISRAQLQDVGSDMHVVGADPQAYSEGAVGWVADRAAFAFPDGTKLPFRLTAVYHREDDAWKLVQQHSSVGIRNEDLFGRQLTLG